MNAAELVEAIRTEHLLDQEPETYGPWCKWCTLPWPCPPAVAADRIEAAIYENDQAHPEWCDIEKVLDGKGPWG